MKPYRVEDIETWLVWKRRIVDGGFSLWQTQGAWDLPQGYLAGFINVDTDERFEIVTHSKEIAEDITHSNL